jgi:hypothetical protein
MTDINALIEGVARAISEVDSDLPDDHPYGKYFDIVPDETRIEYRAYANAAILAVLRGIRDTDRELELRIRDALIARVEGS